MNKSKQVDQLSMAQMKHLSNILSFRTWKLTSLGHSWKHSLCTSGNQDVKLDISIL